MKWKLLLIALSLVVGITARPAEETLSETTTVKTSPETSTILIASTTETPTKKVETTTTADSSPAIRYLLDNMTTKPTNVRNKYANNYANLITKHTLSNSSNLGLNDSSLFVTFQAVIGETKLPTATTSTITNLVESTEPEHVITTRSAYPVLIKTEKPLVNFKVEPPTVETFRQKKKPVIHKIISKWSDNPNDIYNFNGLTTQASQLHKLTTQASQLHKLTTQASQLHKLTTQASQLQNNLNYFDQLPAIYGQQFIHPHTTTIKPPIANTILVSKKKKPAKNSTTVAPTKTKNNCKKVKIKVGNKIINKNLSKGDCDIDIKINNKLHNENSQTQKPAIDDYDLPDNDKFEDANYDSGEKQNLEAEEGAEGNVDVIASANGEGSTVKIKKIKNKTVKKKGSASQLEEEGGGDVGSMVMTMMTMMAVFNPLNIGVWGVVFAPMAAMLFGGMCVAMYQFMHHPISKGHGWQKPQEIVISNKIKHSPIPIKVMHLHKHAPSHPVMEVYGPPPVEYYGPPKEMIISEPIHSYGPPKEMIITEPITSYGPPSKASGLPTVKKPSMSYGEPPVDSYFPVVDSGGPYKRKSNMKMKKPSLVKLTKKPLVKLTKKPLVKLTKKPKKAYKFKLL